MDDVFDDNDDHGETLLPSSLSDLLTPNEMARRMSRTDSREGALPDSPRGAGFAHVGAERLAQSANAALPGNFLEALWSKDGGDARKEGGSGLGVAVGSGGQAKSPATADLSFSPGANAPSLRQSLLSQQRTPAPTSPGVSIRQNAQPAVDAPFLLRDRTDPSSPTARALQQHAPGQSLPGGIAAALSRMHMQPRASSGLAQEQPAQAVRREDHDTHDEEALFQMDNMDL
jgi:cleavage and polyadenylation specificity factor subunit 4